MLPFLNLSGDPEQDYFADGVVEDIITALSRFKSFAVIARNSSFAYKGRAVDVRQVANELGVRYVLEGSVRRAGDRLRIAAQLVDGRTGAHLWAREFRRRARRRLRLPGPDHRERRDAGRAAHPDRRRSSARGVERPRSIAAYDLYLQALPSLFSETAERKCGAYALLTHALALEPDNPVILGHARLVLEPPQRDGLAADRARRPAEMRRAGARGRSSTRAGDATVMALCGDALIHAAKEYDWGMAVIQSAAEANPNSLRVVIRAGICHLHCGDIEDALAYFHRAIRLSPRDPTRIFR